MTIHPQRPVHLLRGDRDVRGLRLLLRVHESGDGSHAAARLGKAPRPKYVVG